MSKEKATMQYLTQKLNFLLAKLDRAVLGVKRKADFV